MSNLKFIVVSLALVVLAKVNCEDCRADDYSSDTNIGASAEGGLAWNSENSNHVQWNSNTNSNTNTNTNYNTNTATGNQNYHYNYYGDWVGPESRTRRTTEAPTTQPPTTQPPTTQPPTTEAPTTQGQQQNGGGKRHRHRHGSLLGNLIRLPGNIVGGATDQFERNTRLGLGVGANVDVNGRGRGNFRY